MQDFYDLIKLLLEPQRIKTTCFMCFKQSDEVINIYETVHIENPNFSIALSLKALIKFVFPLQDIILPQACHLCTDLIINSFIHIKQKEKKEMCFKVLIQRIKEALCNVRPENKKLSIDLIHFQCNKQISNRNTIINICRTNEDIKESTELELTETCPICFSSVDKKTFKAHLRDHKRKRRKLYNCDICDYTTKCKTTLDGHKNNKHFNQRPHICNKCDKGFYTKSALAEHSRTHENTKDIICEICGDTFSRNKTLKDHLKLHANDKMYECCICNVRFVNLSRVNSHMKQKHGEKKELCVVCGKRFVFKKDLIRHTKSVHKTDGIIHTELIQADLGSIIDNL